jgi:hypothetical protein
MENLTGMTENTSEFLWIKTQENLYSSKLGVVGCNYAKPKHVVIVMVWWW